MKKTVVLVLVLLTSFSLLWSNGQNETAAVEGPVAVQLYDWEGSDTERIVEGFNASHDGIQIVHNRIPAPDYETKIMTLLASGMEMDVYMQKNQAHKFAHYGNGFIEVLDPYIEKFDIDMSGVAAYKGDLQIDGSTIALPYRGAGTYVFYNKKVFDAAGEAYPASYVENGTWTWKKYREVAGRLADGEGEVWGSFMAPWGGGWQVPALWQSGAPVITDAGKLVYDPETVFKAFDNRKILESEKAQPGLTFIKVTKLHYSQAFFQGNLGMLIIGEWFPGMLNKARQENLLQNFTWDDWGITYLPCNESSYSSPGQSTFGHVASISKNKDAAFQALAYFGLSDEGAKLAAEAGLMPAMITPEVKEIMGGNIPDKESLGYFLGDFPRTNAAINKYSSPRDDMIGNLMDEYLNMDMSKAELLSTFKKRLEEVVASVN